MPPTLEETIAQLEAILESTHDGILVVSLDRHVVRVNRRLVEMFQFPPAMVERRETAEMIAFVADQLEEADANVMSDDRPVVRTAVSAAAAPGGPPYDIEHRVVRADGTVRWVHEKADVVRDASGRAIRLIGTVQDTTDRWRSRTGRAGDPEPGAQREGRHARRRRSDSCDGGRGDRRDGRDGAAADAGRPLRRAARRRYRLRHVARGPSSRVRAVFSPRRAWARAPVSACRWCTAP